MRSSPSLRTRASSRRPTPRCSPPPPPSPRFPAWTCRIRTAAPAVRLEARAGGAPDVILEGRGDARLSSRADCVQDCLAALADAVAAKTRIVRDVVGDDSLFPDQRWSPGMSWNNIPTRSGTATSALTLDDNELHVRAFASTPGRPPRLELLPYYRDRQSRGDGGGGADRPGVRPASGKPAHSPYRDDRGRRRARASAPRNRRSGRLCRLAASKALLEARGVRVTGAVAVRHRRPVPPTIPRSGAPRRPPVRPGPSRSPGLPRRRSSPTSEPHQQGQPESARRAAAAPGRPPKRHRFDRRRACGGARRCWRAPGCRAPPTTFPTGPECRATIEWRPAGWSSSCAGSPPSPGARPGARSLPVGGVDGTLARRFQGHGAGEAPFRQDGNPQAPTRRCRAT